MNKTFIIKKIVSSVAAASVGYTATTVIMANVPRQTSKLKSLEIVIGTLIIGSMVSDVAEQYTEAQFDKITEMFQKNKSVDAPEEESSPVTGE